MGKHDELTKYIKIRGAREHNLKGIDIDIPRDEFVVLDPANHRWLLIRSMRKGRDVIWSRYLHMPECSWVGWKNRM